MPSSRSAAIIFACVKMKNLGARTANGRRYIFLFNVHVKGIEQKPDVRIGNLVQ